MCLAIVLPAGKEIPEEHLTKAWSSNPDGAGFALAHKNKVIVEKGFMKMQDFLEAFRKARHKHKGKNFLIHFRIRTQGDRLPINTHPFKFEHGVVIHNGSIQGTGAVYGTGKSDTELFIERFGKDLDFATVQQSNKELSEALDYNKLAFLYPDGKYLIINEQKGVWDNGIWYSHSGYKPYKTRVNGVEQ